MIISDKLLPWQHKNWALLHRYLSQERIPQALLIMGARGFGKQRLAKEFASSLLCQSLTDEGFRCGVCNSCLLLKANCHPDLIEITPEEDKKTISINQIRAVIADTTLKPQFERHRVIIINPADVMTISAINAFLKCLEEPGERTAFILITDKPHKLPATMVSRCQKLKLDFPEKHVLREWLKSQGVEGGKDNLLSLLKYSILSIKQLTDNKLLKQREESFTDWLTVAKQESYPAMISEKWQKLPETDLFNWLVSWVSDLIKCGQQCDAGKLCNQDLEKPLQRMALQLELPKLHNLYKLILDCRAQLGGQVNYQLMLEEILVQWQQLNQRN